ncbi:kinesin, putative [Coccidioides posadasii C735 delta SOWgp]|uniref:Kinesin, putative n=1 Tax=Coccidioides posadasii (strain C735) TaxID=222929 RepID=C5PA43_COCP7|nr:kinesin, putative [Coccidioides posadasii C735 delta SOWgp]EER26605.1 kinesin, putative [Coccidioides posadasii C735 delta SOWgp]|eukprot:XP_003068750.1 kinesin, putative [Coccidioides posadasii C735 delta SOWgp]
MESSQSPFQGQTSLFQVYLRLRPPIGQNADLQNQKSDYLIVEPPEEAGSSDDTDGARLWSKYITVQPPNDSRKRAVEKFAFTKVFEERASQLEVFEETGMVPLIKGVLVEGRDGLVATLGVSGSGKSHTILGSKSQRGITQMSLDVLFKSLAPAIQSSDNAMLMQSLAASDPSEAQLYSARSFIESVYGDPCADRGRGSRAQTPNVSSRAQTPLETPVTATFPRRHMAPRPSAFPQTPDVSDFVLSIPEHDEYAVLVSMYEVYNDRIFDLLSPSNGSSNRSANNNQKDSRRPLMFKPTEGSMDRKVVVGLRKVVCSTCEEALTVLETGLTERKVTGTGSNSVSSRSHGFFCVEVKKKIRDQRLGYESWVGNTLTIVDLAGSERARNAKTAGATLAEGGKINESLMYLGQCLQMQTNLQSGSKVIDIRRDGFTDALVPFRQCKLTELLFSNSFPSSGQTAHSSHRIPQKANMIVTADPLGDFNATSQILRYSALAREVTVPRIPSVSSTILAIPAKPAHSGKSAFLSASAEELERAALEIAKLTDDYEALEMRLAEEEMAREEAEIRWKAAEEKCLLLDQEIREECFAEMEERIEDERRRWQQAWDEQTRRHESHLDRKLDLLSRGVEIHEDPEPSTEERVDELERENDMLRTRIAALERELLNRSPTKKTITTSKKNTIPGRFDSLDYSFLKADSDRENGSLTISKKLGRLRLGENLPSSPLSQRERK